MSGNLTRDPEVRYTGEGKTVTTIRIANDEGRDEPLFIDAVCFDALADTVGEHLRKGAKVVVEGRLMPDNWTTDGGEKRTAIRIYARRVEFMSPRVVSETPEAKEEPRPSEPALPF